MSKIVLNDVTNLNSLSVINDNFDKIEQELQNKVLYRDNPDGEPNTFENDVDLNNNNVYNVKTLTVLETFTVNGKSIEEAVSAAAAEIEQSAQSAENSAIAAAASATATAAYVDQGLAVYDQFDDRYLGSKSSNPTVDNDGNVLLVGALYWNTVSSEMRVWSGSAWVAVQTTSAATAAAASASAAATSATNAANSATAAASSTSFAQTYATSAQSYATSAQSYSNLANTSATNSASSATAAATSASNAATSYDQFDDRYLGSKSSDPTLDNDGATLLTGALYWNTASSEMRVWTGSAWVAVQSTSSATSAAASASAAADSASDAATSETNAAASASSAAASSSSASASAVSAANSATSASSSASTAVSSANSANTSATNAGSYATTAQTAAGNASSSAGAAATSATQAQNSATAAATSATNASNSASAAASSATSASSSASSASSSAANATSQAISASSSATAASVSASAAAASYDSFDDRYLGAKGEDPTTDNDGGVLLLGALYWNFNTQQMRVLGNGSVWQVAYLPADGYLFLTGGALTGGLREAKANVGGSDIDINAANYFSRTISSSTTFTVSNVPTTGTAASFILDLTNGGSSAITWWSGMKWVGGTAPSLTASGRDVLGFFTHDGGTTWTGLVLGKDVK